MEALVGELTTCAERYLLPWGAEPLVDGETIWLCGRPGSRTSKFSDSQLQFFVLFAMLHRADPTTASAILRKYVSAKEWFELGLYRRHASMRIGYRIPLPINLVDMENVLRVVAADYATSSDANFQRHVTMLREKIQCLAEHPGDPRPGTEAAHYGAGHGGNDPWHGVNCRIPLALWFDGFEGHRCNASHLSLLTEGIRSAPSSSAFHVVECSFIENWVVLDLETLRCLRALTELRVGIRQLCVAGLELANYEPKQIPETMRLLGDLFSPQSRSVRALDLKIWMYEQDWATMMSLLYAGANISAITLHESSRTLPTNGDDHFALKWKWLAVALADPLSRHQVESITFSIDNPDAVALTPFCQSLVHNPIAEFFGETDDGQERMVVDIRPGAQVALEAPRSTSEDMPIVALDNPWQCTRLRVIPDATSGAIDGWRSILVPAWGPAWVRLEDIVHCDLDERLDCIAPLTSLSRTVRFEFRDVPRATWKPLLRLLMGMSCMGAIVRSLTLTNFVCHQSRQVRWLTTALRWCPHLELLSLNSMHSDVLDAVIAGFEPSDDNDDDERCQLRSLELGAMYGQLSISRLAATLMDPSHRLTQCLEVLSTDILEPMEADLVRTMLDANHRLQFCAFRHPSAWSEDMSASLTATHGRSLPRRERPLPMPSKLALLMALERLPHPAARALSVDELVLVFEFAAVSMVRRVIVRHCWS